MAVKCNGCVSGIWDISWLRVREVCAGVSGNWDSRSMKGEEGGVCDGPNSWRGGCSISGAMV